MAKKRTAKKTWSELSPGQRRAVYVAGAVETVLTAVALLDLSRRPAEEVRGPKAAWALASFVQPVGPLAYLFLGRR
jgi:Phospholipase_D-nuclease N-terminal